MAIWEATKTTLGGLNILRTQLRGGTFTLRSRPKEWVRNLGIERSMRGYFAVYQQRIREAFMQSFWPEKAKRMMQRIRAAMGKGSSGAGAWRGYPKWVAHSKSWQRTKKYRYPEHARDIWIGAGRFMRWLQGVAAGQEVGTSNWNKLNPPASLPYVGINDRGQGKIRQRQIFVFTPEDMEKAEKIIQNVANRMMKDVTGS